MTRILPLLVCLLIVPGCNWLGGGGRQGEGVPPARFDTADSGQDALFLPEPIIDALEPTVTSLDGAAVLTLFVAARGWTDGVMVDIYATGSDDRLERFIFPVESRVERCDDGWCDEWEHRITEADTYDDVGATMTLSAADLAVSSGGAFTQAAFRVRVLPQDPQYDVQCAMWGHRSREMFGDDCECFEAFLAQPPADPCGDNTGR